MALLVLIVSFLFVNISIAAATQNRGGGIVTKQEQFHVASDKSSWYNTSVIIHSEDYENDIELLLNLLALYPDNSTSLLRNIVGDETFVDALEIDQRASYLLKGHYGIDVSKRDYVYQAEIPSYSLKSGRPSRQCTNMVAWPAWMQCYVNEFKVPGSHFVLAIVEYVWGNSLANSYYKRAWLMAGSGQLGKALAVTGIGLAFKGNNVQNKCTSVFLVTNEKFTILSASTSEDPTFLVGVIPNNKKGGSCKTNTSALDLSDDVALLFDLAMQKSMAAFCITLTGKLGWFNSNNWYGQVKVFPMRDSGTLRYGQLPCVECISERRMIPIFNWFKDQYNTILRYPWLQTVWS